MYLAIVVVWSVCGTSMVQFYVWICKRVMGPVLQCKSRKKACYLGFVSKSRLCDSRKRLFFLVLCVGS